MAHSEAVLSEPHDYAVAASYVVVIGKNGEPGDGSESDQSDAPKCYFYAARGCKALFVISILAVTFTR